MRAATVVQVLHDFEAPPTIAPRPPTTVAKPHIDRSLGSKETHTQSHNRGYDMWHTARQGWAGLRGKTVRCAGHGVCYVSVEYVAMTDDRVIISIHPSVSVSLSLPRCRFSAACPCSYDMSSVHRQSATSRIYTLAQKHAIKLSFRHDSIKCWPIYKIL